MAVSIFNTKSNTLLSGTSGNDTIQNGGWDKNLNLHAGGSNVTINGGAGNDTIRNSYYSPYVNIDGGIGNDTLTNESDNVTITGGSGKDLVISDGAKVKIDGGIGDDTISSNANNVTITGGTGDDSIGCGTWTDVKNCTISGGIGNDYIEIDYGKNLTISGDADDDIISLGISTLNNVNVKNCKISGDAGNDIISLGSNAKNTVIKYASGDGNDSIFGFDSNDTLQITSGTYSTTKSGNNLIVTVGNGKIALDGAAKLSKVNIKGTFNGSGNKGVNISNKNNHTVITGTAYNDTIYNSDTWSSGEGEFVTIKGNSGDDIIVDASSYNVKIYGGDGNDTVSVTGGLPVTVFGDAGNDSIVSFARATVNGGNGSDTIEIGAGVINGGNGDDILCIVENWNNNTINGGNGNDEISIASNSEYNIIQYASGDGNDTIRGFNSDDTLQIAGSYTTTKSGKNLIVEVDKGSILLKDVSSANIVTISGGTDDDGGDDEKNSWKISGTTATYGTSSKTLVTVKGVKSVDGLSLSGKVVTVKNSSLNNSKVTISNGYTLKLADDVSSSTTKKAAWSYANSTATYKSSYKTAGYSLASDGKSISYTKATSAKTLAKITGAKSKNGLSLSGKKITLKKSALSKKVTVSGSYEFDFLSGYKNATISGTKNNDTITARGSNISIFGGKGNDSIKLFGSSQTVSGGAGADTFIYASSGGKEKIIDFQSNDTLKIGENGNGTYSTVTSGSDVIVTVGKGEVTLVGAAGKSLNIAGTINDTQSSSTKGVKVKGKKITLTSDYTDSSFSLSGKYSSAVTLTAANVLRGLNITGNEFANSILGSSQDDTIDGGESADTIYGGNGNDSIFGGTGNDELHGGIGDDTLWGGAGNDELYGDADSDVFYYNIGEGNDTIFGYDFGVDKIILASGTISNVTSNKNNDVIFTIGDYRLVVNEGAENNIQIVGLDNKPVDNGLWPRSH